jgi:hypothetical protein
MYEYYSPLDHSVETRALEAKGLSRLSYALLTSAQCACNMSISGSVLHDGYDNILRKFSAVFGTRSLYKEKIILPTGLSPMVMSKWVIKRVDSEVDIRE